MASPSRPSPWPQYPEIPIFLDTQDGDGTPRSYRITEHTLQTPETVSGARPIQYLTATSPIQARNFSQKYSIPVPARQFAPQQSRRPTLRSFLPVTPQIYKGREPDVESAIPKASNPGVEPLPSTRLQAHGRSPSYSQKTGNVDRKPSHGLGILGGSSNLAPPLDRSPTGEKDESLPNIAQRIEKRLWQYTSSGNVVQKWLLEIISWIISAMCMGAIIGVLIFYKDKGLPRWPLGITLNAYIAVLSKLASAALLLPTSEALGQLKWSWFQGDSKKMWDFEIFDNASRGPWGAILLLIRTKGRALAALGAAVTLLSLALDPFFQQVVDFPDRWTLQGNSSIPKVMRYEPRRDIQLQDGEEIVQQDQDLQSVAQKFFYDNGTQPVPFGNGTRPDIPLSCPTSNCTWPLYETLGFCSACADVSQHLTFGCLTTKLDWVSNITDATNDTACGYFLNATSESPILMSGYKVDPVQSSAGEALLMRTLPLYTNPTRKLLFGGSINFKHIRNPIFDVLIVGAADSSASVYRNETPIAHECVLSWCVQTIKSSYYWANYREEVVDSFMNTTTGPSPWKTSKFQSPTFNGTETFYLQNITLDTTLDGRNTTNYGLSNDTALSTIVIFDDIFPSFATVANSSATTFLRFKVRVKGAATLRSFDANPWLPPNNLTRHLERLATSMTNVIRSSSNKKMVPGMAYSKENYVAVRWEWLTLPLSLLLLSLIFLVSTIIRTSREKDQVGVWKTSAIATLLYGLPDDMQRKITASSSLGTPRAKAKELRVKLLPKMGWRVSGNLLSPMTPNIRINRPLFPPTTPKARNDRAPPGWI